MGNLQSAELPIGPSGNAEFSSALQQEQDIERGFAVAASGSGVRWQGGRWQNGSLADRSETATAQQVRSVRDRNICASGDVSGSSLSY
jgi:hypothetical protein